MKSILAVLIMVMIMLFSGCGPVPDTGVMPDVTPSVTASVTTTPTATSLAKPLPSLKLEDYDGGFFTMKKPVGWDVATAGACSTFSFCAIDKTHPANRIFYFGEVGPVYLAAEQKTIDQDYMDMGGYPVLWFEMPVINPLTPENFLANFHLVAQTNIARDFMPGVPELGDIEIISSAEETAFLSGGQTRIIRALFRQGGELGEGLFYITVAPLLPVTGYPSAGIGYGFCFTGITAVREDFKYYQDELLDSIYSLNFSQDYIANCLKQQQRQWDAVRSIGDTLSETSDILTQAWENRNRSDDILSEKRSDAILGYDRVYNPDTGEVYEVPLDFYDDYDLHREKYNMDDLQKLPDQDWDLWTAPTEPVTEID